MNNCIDYKATDDIIFRWLRKDEAEIGMKAIAQLWRPDHILATDRSFFFWQFENGPDKNHLGFILALEGTKIIGCVGIIILPYHIKNKLIKGFSGSMMKVDPFYAKKGLGLELIRYLDNYFIVSNSFSMRKRLASILEMMGSYVREELPRYIMTPSKDFLQAYLEAACYRDNISATILSSVSVMRTPIPNQKYHLESLTTSNLHEWGDAWDNSFAPFLIGCGRPAGYVAWRYLRHPRYDYRTFIQRDNAGKITAFLAFRVIDLPGGTSALRILDFLPLTEEAGNSLAAALAGFMPINCAYAEFFFLGEKGKSLEKIGMSRAASHLISTYTQPPDPDFCRLRTVLCTDKIDYTPMEFATSPEIYLTLADGDQDRPN